MATLAELQAKKTKLETAIDKVLVAQEYSEGATRVKKANLDILYQRLDELNVRIDMLTTGKVSLRPVFGDAK